MNRAILVALLLYLLSQVIIIYFLFSNQVPPLDVGALISAILSVMGTVVTALSFLAGTYFVLLAINAYSYLREIERVKNDAEKFAKNSESVQHKLENSFGDMAETMDEVVSSELYMVDHNVVNNNAKEEERERIEKFRNKMLRSRSRIALRCKYMDPKRRKALILELASVGEEEDLELLRGIQDSQMESNEIKRLAKLVIQYIEKKTRSKNQK